MSTSGRPTYAPAMGTKMFGGLRSAQVSAKDQVGHKKLKFRQIGQSAPNEMIGQDLKSKLNSTNVVHHITESEEIKISPPLLIMDKVDESKSSDLLKKFNDADASDDSKSNLDSSSEESDDSDDDEDDELELQAELERIKAERVQALARKEQEESMIKEKTLRDSAARGNPLLNLDDDGSSIVKRRWNDDVVFRHQAKDEPSNKKRFINDTIRNDFHRSFLKKFIK